MPITTAADNKFCNISFLIFQRNKEWYGMMIFYENCLMEDDSHKISCLIGYFWKRDKIWNCRLLQIIGGALWVKRDRIMALRALSHHLRDALIIKINQLVNDSVTSPFRVKSVYQKIFFFFLNQNICCGYSKEPSQWDGSFEHPKYMLKLMGKKIFTFLCWNFLFI